jgi:hypothetical protein
MTDAVERVTDWLHHLERHGYGDDTFVNETLGVTAGDLRELLALASRDPEAAKLIKSGIENRMRWYAANKGDINREILALDCAEAATLIEQLEEALKPFAHYCELNDLLDSGDPKRVIEVPVRDLQRAHAALGAANTPEQQGDGG